MVFEWDNAVMGLRDETRIEGLLAQTHFGMVLNGDPRSIDRARTVVRYGLHVVVR